MGLYTQPPEVQADLLAYWQILHTDDPVRFSLLGSKRLADESYLASLRRRGGRAGRQPVIGPAAGRVEGMSVLLIDDDSRLYELLAQYLGQNGVNVTHAADGGWGLAGDDVGGR